MQKRCSKKTKLPAPASRLNHKTYKRFKTASIYKRKDGKGWRAVIRIKNHPTVCGHFDRKEEAEDWAKETELKIKLGKYSPNKAKERTVADLIDLYIKDVVIDHHKASKDSIRQLNYFRETLGKYALAYINPELLLKERRKLSEISTRHNTKINPATINRYFSTLSGAFRFACKNLRWIDENPCINLLKLKSRPKERRVLAEDEDIRLLQACRQSQSPYLYCIVLIALTTGSRKSEILNLNWDAIDLDNRIAYIKDSKNGQPRRVGLVGSVIAELKKLYDSIKGGAYEQLSVSIHKTDCGEQSISIQSRPNATFSDDASQKCPRSCREENWKAPLLEK